LSGRKLPPEQIERRRTAWKLGGRPVPLRSGGNRQWTAKELALLGSAPDAEIATRIGRTVTAVMRTRLGRPTALDRQRKQQTRGQTGEQKLTPARPSGSARGRTCSPSASSACCRPLSPRRTTARCGRVVQYPAAPGVAIDPDNVSGTRGRRVAWPTEAENRPPAPRKDIRRDQQLAALLTAWWGSGDLDAARVLADARGRAPAAGDREGRGIAHVTVLEYLHTQKHLHGAGVVSAGPTCLSSPASVCRACSHACSIGDTRWRAQASRPSPRSGSQNRSRALARPGRAGGRGRRSPRA